MPVPAVWPWVRAFLCFLHKNISGHWQFADPQANGRKVACSLCTDWTSAQHVLTPLNSRGFSALTAGMVQTRQRGQKGANGKAKGNAVGKSSNGFVVGPDGDEKTDYSRWRLLDEDGRHTWHYLRTDKEVEAWPQTVADKFHLGLPTVRVGQGPQPI